MTRPTEDDRLYHERESERERNRPREPSRESYEDYCYEVEEPEEDDDGEEV